MGTQFAPGTSCTPCLALGHQCPAYDYDDQKRPACIACIDEVPCEKARSSRSVMPIKRDAHMPTPKEAKRAIEVHESMAEEPPTAAEPICARCHKPKHWGGCAGIPRAKRRLPATPAANAPQLPKSAPQPFGQSVVVRIDSIPGRESTEGVHNKRLEEFRSLPPGMALAISFETQKEAYVFYQRFRSALKRAKLRSSGKLNQSTVYFWNAEPAL